MLCTFCWCLLFSYCVLTTVDFEELFKNKKIYPFICSSVERHFFYLYTSLWLLTKCISLEVPGLFSSFSFNCVIQSLLFFTNEKQLLYKSAISFGGCVCVCVCAQSCLTLCDPMNCSLSVSSIHGIFQARILESIQNDFLKSIFTVLLFFL